METHVENGKTYYGIDMDDLSDRLSIFLKQTLPAVRAKKILSFIEPIDPNRLDEERVRYLPKVDKLLQSLVLKTSIEKTIPIVTSSSLIVHYFLVERICFALQTIIKMKAIASSPIIRIPFSPETEPLCLRFLVDKTPVYLSVGPLLRDDSLLLLRQASHWQFPTSNDPTHLTRK
ncbi:hypothetical protein SCACP_30570 [Sporomusa carbonis]|uniref:hypothetical protein n=1 Tax=Sporomusa carbonis TaxID=3076075 RepID=UPI003A5D5135